MLPPKEKSSVLNGSKEDRTGDAASRRTTRPTHYRMSCTGTCLTNLPPQEAASHPPSLSVQQCEFIKSSAAVSCRLAWFVDVLLACVSLFPGEHREHCSQTAGVVWRWVTNLT